MTGWVKTCDYKSQHPIGKIFYSICWEARYVKTVDAKKLRYPLNRKFIMKYILVKIHEKYPVVCFGI